MTEGDVLRLIGLLSSQYAEAAYEEFEDLLACEPQWIVSLVEAFDKSHDVDERGRLAACIIRAYRYGPAEEHLRRHDGWTESTFRKIIREGGCLISREQFEDFRRGAGKAS